MRTLSESMNIVENIIQFLTNNEEYYQEFIEIRASKFLFNYNFFQNLKNRYKEIMKFKMIAETLKEKQRKIFM